MKVEQLKNENRLLLEAKLTPIQGQRFQPTGFPNLGAANYIMPDGREMLLVESAQSMANRLESVCWDSNNDQIHPDLNGLPYVEVVDKDTGAVITNSLLEAHRLNSPYILESKDKTFSEMLQEKTDSMETGPVDVAKLARVVFSYDPGAVLHGIFFSRKELAGGRLRMQRLLSAFIEAENVRPVESGGVKNDRVDPKGETKKGFGNVPFARTEYVADNITAYFNLDLAALYGYQLVESAQALLLNLSLWKIDKFLTEGLRLRTACDFELDKLTVCRPDINMPEMDGIRDQLSSAITNCKQQGMFVDPPVTRVVWSK